MLLACIFAVLCLPLVVGFSRTTFVYRWRYCRVLGFAHQDVQIPAKPQYVRDLETAYLAYKAGVSAQHYKPRRRVRVGKFRFVTI